MTDRLEREEHPVAFGLLALVGVAIVVGLIAGMAALAGARVAGLGDESPSGDGNGGGATLFLPKPEPTKGPRGPLITLAPGQETAQPEEQEPSEDESSDKPAKGISLQVAQSTVSPMDNIDLTGVYPGGEGAILQVQRFEGGSWQDFPVTVSVSNGTFTTYVQTGQTGPNRFRVVDTDTGKPSNEVKVTIG
ncbi:hypothetical protein [Nocardioides euryhalodurans]|uniref:Uncharacterized protein n=1 Tax=Nocardioides euryhalodurans TaxID=2518370 RepID=A0A4P7GM08_9ACTN|nr:hypothetical protein [Nocardioides euryhalodurans]QBR93188.1 hypothetical protein EXE57_13615 [Nocardioides euryhalodurans]